MKPGDKVILTNPDRESLRIGLKKGDIFNDWESYNLNEIGIAVNNSYYSYAMKKYQESANKLWSCNTNYNKESIMDTIRNIPSRMKKLLNKNL